MWITNDNFLQAKRNHEINTSQRSPGATASRGLITSCKGPRATKYDKRTASGVQGQQHREAKILLVKGQEQPKTKMKPAESRGNNIARQTTSCGRPRATLKTTKASGVQGQQHREANHFLKGPRATKNVHSDESVVCQMQKAKWT